MRAASILVALIGVAGALAGAGLAVAGAGLHGGSGVVTVDGHVGALQFGVTTAAGVQRFAGRADFIGVATFEVPRTPDFLALGYDCSQRRSRARIDPTAYRPSHTYCRTVYYVSTKTLTLGAFWTSSPAFHTMYGTRPGTSQSYANAHEDALPEFGCHQGMSRGSAVADLLIDTRGGHAIEQTRGGLTYLVRIDGGVVNDFALEARMGGVGLLFC